MKKVIISIAIIIGVVAILGFLLAWLGSFLGGAIIGGLLSPPVDQKQMEIYFQKTRSIYS